MRQHFKQPTSKFAPHQVSRHTLGRAGHHLDSPDYDVYRQRITKPTEPAFRRKVRAKASTRMGELAFYQVGTLFGGHMRRVASRPGFVRRMFDPEGCAAIEKAELEVWVEAKRNEKWTPRYHQPADYGRLRQAMKPLGTFGAS